MSNLDRNCAQGTDIIHVWRVRKRRTLPHRSTLPNSWSIEIQKKPEAVLARSSRRLLGKDEFLGEGCLTGRSIRIATTVAMTDCEITRIEKQPLFRRFTVAPDFSEMLLAHVLLRTARVEEDLIDQLFNSSERRLARTLLLLANFGKRKNRTHPGQSNPGNACRDDWNNPLARELLHEQVPKAGFHQLQRQAGGA